jgi:hypothetical protein
VASVVCSLAGRTVLQPRAVLLVALLHALAAAAAAAAYGRAGQQRQ